MRVGSQGMNTDVFKFDSSYEFLYPDKNNSSLLSAGQAACFSHVREGGTLFPSATVFYNRVCFSIHSYQVYLFVHYDPAYNCLLSFPVMSSVYLSVFSPLDRYSCLYGLLYEPLNIIICTVSEIKIL